MKFIENANNVETEGFRSLLSNLYDSYIQFDVYVAKTKKLLDSIDLTDELARSLEKQTIEKLNHIFTETENVLKEIKENFSNINAVNIKDKTFKFFCDKQKTLKEKKSK